MSRGAETFAMASSASAPQTLASVETLASTCFVGGRLGKGSLVMTSTEIDAQQQTRNNNSFAAGCRSFIAGNRNSFAGTRSGSFHEVTRPTSSTNDRPLNLRGQRGHFCVGGGGGGGGEKKMGDNKLENWEMSDNRRRRWDNRDGDEDNDIEDIYDYELEDYNNIGATVVGGGDGAASVICNPQPQQQQQKQQQITTTKKLEREGGDDFYRSLSHSPLSPSSPRTAIPLNNNASGDQIIAPSLLFFLSKFCLQTKNNFRRLWRFWGEVYIYLCDSYNLESDWERMGVTFRFKVIDAVLSLAVLSPLTVLFYVSTWGILDYLFLDRFPVFGAWILLLVAIGIETTAGVFQNQIRQLISPPEKETESTDTNTDTTQFYNVPAIVFRYVIALTNVAHMRSVEALLSYYTGSDGYNSFRTVITTLLILVGLRCFKCVLGPPLVISLDTEPQGKVAFLNDIEVGLFIYHSFYSTLYI